MRESDKTKILLSLEKEISFWRKHKKSRAEKLPFKIVKKLMKLSGEISPFHLSKRINLANSTITKYFTRALSDEDEITKKDNLEQRFIEINPNITSVQSLEIKLIHKNKEVIFKGELKQGIFLDCLSWLNK